MTDNKNAVYIWINDRKQSLDAGTSVDQLLKQLMVASSAIAVEVNRELVLRADFAATILKEGDRLEIVSLSGGG